MRKHLAFLLAMVMVLSIAAIPAYASGEEKVLNIATLSDMSTMDVAQTTSDYFVPNNIFDRLFEIKVLPDGSNEIVNSVVTDYSVSDDGLTYTMTIRDDVTFSNGNALTAEDVKYTFVRLLTAGGVNTEIPLEVAGAQALMDGEAEDLEGFQVTGDYEFTITLNAPNAGFVAELTSPAMSLVDEETCESVENFGMEPADTIGSGPYIITEWVPNDHYTLVRNEDYWGELPSVQTVIRHIVPDGNTQDMMFQNGEIDIIDLDVLDASIVAGSYKAVYPAEQIVAAHRLGISYIALNENNEYLSDVNVRKAIQMAVNRQSMLDNIYDGEGNLENGIVATGVWGHNPDLAEIPYDPEAAKALLADYEEGEISFELALNNDDTGNYLLAYQSVQQDLAAVGINVTIETYDSSAWLELRKSGEMDSFIQTWTMDYNDPANIMVVFFGNEENTKTRSLNYPDTEIMDRVSAATNIVDDDERMAEYQALEEQIVIEDAAWVPLYERNHLFCIGEKVESFVPHWAGYTDFFVRDVVMK